MGNDQDKSFTEIYDKYYEEKKEKGKTNVPTKRRRKRIALYKQIIGEGQGQILEIGCGFGDLTYNLLDISEQVVGTDISQVAVEIARSRYPIWNIDADQLQRIRFEPMSALSLEFPDDTFDWVISTSVVEHLYPEDTPTHFKEVRRVLKPGGSYLVWCPNGLGNHKDRTGHFSMFSYAEWMRRMTLAGFEDLRSPVFVRPPLVGGRFKVALERVFSRLGIKVMWSHLGLRNVLLVGRNPGQ